MAELIELRNEHTASDSTKEMVKRKRLKHEIRCTKCKSLSKYTSDDRDEKDYIECKNPQCALKLLTDWGDDDELVERRDYELTT